MEWRDEGILLAARRHGESAAIAEIFTAAHGRHAGVVRGGAGRRMAPVLQPGARLSVVWSARLEEHVGAFRVEPTGEPAAEASALLDDAAALAALGSVAALVLAVLPERDPHPVLYDRTRTLLAALGAAADWPARYAAWELALLADLGFGLDLTTCAVTGAREGLAFVSPRTGRAVSRAGAGDWADRLLPLPPFLATDWTDTPPPGDVAIALALTGHFLEARIAPSLRREALPPARARAVTAILRRIRQ